MQHVLAEVVGGHAVVAGLQDGDCFVEGLVAGGGGLVDGGALEEPPFVDDPHRHEVDLHDPQLAEHLQEEDLQVLHDTEDEHLHEDDLHVLHDMEDEHLHEDDLHVLHDTEDEHLHEDDLHVLHDIADEHRQEADLQDLQTTESDLADVAAIDFEHLADDFDDAGLYLQQ